MCAKYRPHIPLTDLTPPAAVVSGNVRNIYDGPQSSPDYDSAIRMGDHLSQRLMPRQIGSRVVSVVVPNGHRNRWSVYRDGWLIPPKGAALASAVGLGIMNVVGNGPAIAHNTDTVISDLGEEYRNLKFHAQHGTGTPDKTITIPDTFIHDTQYGTLKGTTNSEVGKSEVDPEDVEQILGDIISHPTLKGGGAISKIEVRGNSSDDPTFGKSDKLNTYLGQKRGEETAAALGNRLQATSIPHPEIVVIKPKEEIINRGKLEKLDKIANTSGYETFKLAVKAYDNGAKLPDELRKAVEQEISNSRGTKVTVDFQKVNSFKDPGMTEFVKGFNPPVDLDRDYDDLKLFPWLVPPIPRLRAKLRKEPKGKRVNFVEPGDPVWFRLYEDAIDENGQLAKDLSWYTRKMNYLLRDDRVKKVEEATVVGDDEEERSMRMCFVDHEPTDEAMEKIRDVIRYFARANGGTLPDTISTIMFYPSDNAGTAHNDPSRIGLGIDNQDPEEVLGVTTPLLGLVELHMSTDPTPEELNHFFGAVWTLAHELGHGIDIDPSKPQQLVKLLDGSYVSVNTWRDLGDSVHQNLLPVEGKMTGHNVKYKITVEERDRKGKIRRVERTVNQDHPDIARAIDAQIIGHRPTIYASGDSAEHLAETAAAAATSIDIPYSQAGVTVSNDPGFSFAEGYRPAKESLDAFYAGTGIKPGDERLANSRVSFRTTSVKDDPWLHGLAERARNTPVPEEDDMLRVLGWVIS